MLALPNHARTIGSVFQNGAEDVKGHRWFKDIDWEDVYDRKLKVCFPWILCNLHILLMAFHKNMYDVYSRVIMLQAPIIPRVTFEGDTTNFEEYAEADWKSIPDVGEEESKLFEDF